MIWEGVLPRAAPEHGGCGLESSPEPLPTTHTFHRPAQKQPLQAAWGPLRPGNSGQGQVHSKQAPSWPHTHSHLPSAHPSGLHPSFISKPLPSRHLLLCGMRLQPLRTLQLGEPPHGQVTSFVLALPLACPRPLPADRITRPRKSPCSPSGKARVRPRCRAHPLLERTCMACSPPSPWPL